MAGSLVHMSALVLLKSWEKVTLHYYMEATFVQWLGANVLVMSSVRGVKCEKNSFLVPQLTRSGQPSSTDDRSSHHQKNEHTLHFCSSSLATPDMKTINDFEHVSWLLHQNVLSFSLA